MMKKRDNIRERIFFCTLMFTLFCTLMYGGGRQKINLGTDWKFKSQMLSDDPSLKGYDDSFWETVTIPHTWNSLDAQDGGNNYLRTVGWYRKLIPWDTTFEGKKLYLEFLGVNMQAECFVNGVTVGKHKGGYTAFRFDVTSQMKPGNNEIAIKTDNRHSEEIAPLNADFSFFGGMYRDVNLIGTNLVHVDLMDYGSSALYLTTTDVSEKSAELEIKARIVNDSNFPQKISLTAILHNPGDFKEIIEVSNPVFDINEMKQGGAILEKISRTVTIQAGESYLFREKVKVNNPHLWNGKKDPYRYLVDFIVSQNNKVIDNVSDYVGFRSFSVTNKGFFLNGKLYPLRGVNRHQDRKDMGNAISKKEHNEDFGLIYEMGANAIRLSHYPQDPYFYKLCDQYGLIVWAEIPLIDRLGKDSLFNDVTKNQLRELIRQQYNCPSICIWGLQNEIRKENDTKMKLLMNELNDLAHEEDSTRLTTQATNHETARNWDSDIFAWNFYPGWYVKDETLGQRMDKFLTQEERSTGVSEYGAGGSIYQHELNLSKPVATRGKWHPEEYQSKIHEDAIRDISTRDFVWGTFLWNMFDFASDNRDEGDQAGINDKGLITYDRKVKKDSFFAYKVNWSNDPTVYISSRRYTIREESIIPVMVYSNCKTVELFVNGVSQGIKQHNDVQCGFFKWDNNLLVAGENEIVAKGKIGRQEYVDTVIFRKEISNSTDLSSAIFAVDNQSKKIVLTKNVEVTVINQYLTGMRNATFVVVDKDGKTSVIKGEIKMGMKVNVTAEDGIKKAVYEFNSNHIANNKNVTGDSEESGNVFKNAVDGNQETRWAANDNEPHWIEVDLGKEYALNKIVIHWDNPDGNRIYKYTVMIGNENKKYTTVIDRSKNMEKGIVPDEINTIGRYVKINISGSNSYAVKASLYEIEVYGWKLESDKYVIDYNNHTINIPVSERNVTSLTTNEFLGNIIFSGNIEYSLNSESYFIQSNDALIISDSSGKQFKFKLIFAKGSLISVL